MSRARVLVFTAVLCLGFTGPVRSEDPPGNATIDDDLETLDGSEPPKEPTPDPDVPAGPKVDTTGLPIQEKILAESFPGYFEPMKQEKTYFWSLDLNGDEIDDLVIWARSKIKVPNAWKKLPIHNPPYEWASRGEIQENPMFETHYSIREGERYLIVYHSGPKGWAKLSVGAAHVLQDVSETAPEPTTFGEEDEKVNGLKFRYEGKPGLLYWAGDRYVAAMKDESE